MNLSALMDRLVEVSEQDEEFLHWARFVESNVRLGIGATGFILRFSGGHIIGISGDHDPTVAWDYEIVGPESDWVRMWRGEMDFMQARVPKHGSVAIRGDRVRFGADIAAIDRLVRLLPKAAAKLGVEVKPAGPPATQGDPDPWRTRHDVLGRYVNVQGVRTYYETIGDKSSVAFLAMHSAGRDCRQWQQFGDVIAEAGQLFALDLPGRGKSWPLPGGCCLTTMDEIASFTWAFRNAAGITIPTVVLGCSMGGSLVFQLAAEHSDEVVALISFEGSDLTGAPPEAELVLMDHPRVNIAYNHAPRTISVAGSRAALSRVDYLRWEVRSLSSISIKSDLTAYSRFDFRSRMQEVRCPALLVRGTDDYLVYAERVTDSARRLTNARVVEVVMPEGVGHYAHVEQPVELARLTLDFLRRHGIIPKEKKG